MAKEDVRTQQFGEILFIFALETTLDNLKNEEIVENLNLEPIDQIIQIQEMVIIYMFGTILALQDANIDEYEEVLDFMHKTYDETLTQKLNFNNEQLQVAHYDVKNRYKEYLLAKEEKRGPTWLWPIINHMLDNLQGKKTEDLNGMTHLTGLFSTYLEVLPTLIDKYRIVKN